MQSKTVVIRKIQRPEGDDPNTPVERYLHSEEYYSIYRFEGDCETRHFYRVTEQYSAYKKRLKDLLTKIEKMNNNDIERLNSAIILIDFLLEEGKNISKEDSVPVDIIALILVIIYKISEEAKQRNQILIADNGWWLFDLLGKLFCTRYTHDEPLLNQMPEYFDFRHKMLPKIVADDLVKIKSILLQIHDTEMLLAGDKNTVLFPKFIEEPALLNEIVELQKSIEEKIALSQKTDEDDTKLTKIVKKYSLQLDLFNAQLN